MFERYQKFRDNGGTKASVKQGQGAVTSQFAVCVAGAVRSMIENTVYQNSLSNLVKPVRKAGGDLFYHLMVGREVSQRGQDGKTHPDAIALARASL